jgi:hypothetical protein
VAEIQGVENGERETQLIQHFGMARSHSSRQEINEERDIAEIQQLGIPGLRYRLVVKGLPLKFSSWVWLLKNSESEVYKKEITDLPLLLSGLQVLEEDPHQERSTRIFFSSQSQEFYSSIVSKSNCSLFVPAFLLVIFLVGLIKNFLTKFAFCL